MRTHVRSALLSANLLHCINLAFAKADPLDEWTWRSPLPQGNTLRAVTYANNLFVAVGEAGTVVTSPDGATWTLRPTPTTQPLNGVASGNGVFVAVGGLGHPFSSVVLTSSDGQAWTPRSAPAAGPLTGIAFGQGMFAVSVGGLASSQAILTSTDGVTWTAQTTGSTTGLNGNTIGNGLFVAAGNNGRILTSRDGVTWIRQNSGFAGTLGTVAYGNGVFVVARLEFNQAGNGPITSPNGVVWTKQDSGLTFEMQCLTFGGGQFLAVGGGAGAFWVASSADGISFNELQIGLAGLSFYGATHGAGQFVVVGTNGRIFTSPDAATWTERSKGSNADLTAIASGNETIVAVGSSWHSTAGVALASKDGISWTEHEFGFSLVTALAFGKGLFVVGHADGSVWTSPDSAAWTLRDTGAASAVLGLAFGNGVFVLIGNENDGNQFTGRILTSNDGITWIARTHPSAALFQSLSFADGKFFISELDVTSGLNRGGADTTGFLSSADGSEWNQRETNLGRGSGKLVHGNGTFVASIALDTWDSRSAIIVSADAEHWTRTCASLGKIESINFVDGLFVAVGTELVSRKSQLRPMASFGHDETSLSPQH